MKRKALRIILVIALVIAALPITAAPAALAGASAEATLAAAYKAYYEVLKEAVDEYGIGWHESTNGPGRGLVYAGLIDFDNDGLPELMYKYLNNQVVDFYCIYGYSGGAELLTSGVVGGDAGWYSSFEIVTDRSGVSYLHENESYSSDFDEYEDGEDNSYEEDTYYTVKGGEWVEVSGVGIDIVSSIDTSRSDDSVRDVLAKLQSSPTAAPPAVAALDALPSAWSLNVNGGTLRGTDMYNIGGSNYLKIRDIAALLDGTDKQFNITVDGRTVNMIPGAVYEARGDEMAANPNAVQTKTSVTTFDFALEGKPIELT